MPLAERMDAMMAAVPAIERRRAHSIASESFLRITEQKEYLRMPPIGSLGVDPLAIELIGRWIDAGAR